jgi:hypothetical protein
MSLSDDLHQQIVAYVGGKIDADDLFGFLVSTAPDVTPTSDVMIRQTWGTAFSLLSELSSGETDEDGVRDELRELAGGATAHVHGQRQVASRVRRSGHGSL